MKIIIETIPHESQRYPTVGDWYRDESDNLVIRVSRLSTRWRESLVAIHELIEVLLCEYRGITSEQVDSFDKAFEAVRPKGNDDEPGDDPSAPYRKEHFFATTVERLLAAELGIDWRQYEREINALQ